MLHDLARCPRCGKMLRLVREPSAELVQTICPGCGASLMLASDPGLVLVAAGDAERYLMRRLLRGQKIELATSIGSTGVFGGVVAAAIFASMPVAYGAVAIVGAVLAAGAGALPVVVDARLGAAERRSALPEEDNLLLVEPDGYRQ